jgi:hypothetical protein
MIGPLAFGVPSSLNRATLAAIVSDGMQPLMDGGLADVAPTRYAAHLKDAQDQVARILGALWRGGGS